ncbi:hypothetical protein, partial [Streptomyces sp. NPDC058424]|uniref:hypothetical protein n=1 Tax=Streptomyces sp. NPDC058424 TaxID=3346491 RepID=UPI00366342DC
MSIVPSSNRLSVTFQVSAVGEPLVTVIGQRVTAEPSEVLASIHRRGFEVISEGWRGGLWAAGWVWAGGIR